MNKWCQNHLFRANTTFCTKIRKLSVKDILVHELIGNKIAQLLYHVMDPATHKKSFRGAVSVIFKAVTKALLALRGGLSRFIEVPTICIMFNYLIYSYYVKY